MGYYLMVYSHWIEWTWTEPNQVNRLKHGRTCVVKPHAMQKETCMRSRFNCVSAKLPLRFGTICAVKMPKRSARWTDEVTLELTEEFRNHPELWKVKSLKTKRRPLYLKTQPVPRSKHFSSRLQKPISLCCNWHKSLFVLRKIQNT